MEIDGGWSKTISNSSLLFGRHGGSRNNTENYVGTVKYPIGVIGPLKASKCRRQRYTAQLALATLFLL